ASCKTYADAAELAHTLGLGINAGHDLDLNNLPLFRRLPHLQEVSSATRSSATRCMSAWKARYRAISIRLVDHEMIFTARARKHEVCVSWWSIGAALAMMFVLTADASAQRRVTFRAEDGATLSGAYYESSRRPAPGIVLLHMLTRSHADW